MGFSDHAERSEAVGPGNLSVGNGSPDGGRGSQRFTCTTFAGGKPLKYVAEAWL